MRRFNFIAKLIFIALIALPVLVRAFDVPERPNAYLQDYAKVLSPEEVTALETKLENYEQNTTNEIAVVTIPSLGGDVIENVAQEIFTTWGIGKAENLPAQAGNNGVLVLVSLEDRRARIHTGYGVEAGLTDIETQYIQQEVLVPAFRDGKYYEGLDSTVDRVIESLGGNAIVPPGYTENTTEASAVEIILFIIIFFILIAIISTTGTGGFLPLFIGGGRNGSSSGGGFGGFGGGMSGGGGSSSSW